MKIKTFRLSLILSLLSLATLTKASDTLEVRSHNNVRLNWYGNFYTKTKFPDANEKFKQVLLKFTIGCPSIGCSDWDYTTKVFARRQIGTDTVAVLKPKYKIGTQAFDSVRYSHTPLYKTFYNSTTQSTDSNLVAPQKLYYFLDSLNYNTASDSDTVYVAGYTNFYYTSNGTISDSVQIKGSDKLIQSYWSIPQYNKVYEYIEFARYITPYAGDKQQGFFRSFVSDITDFSSVLRDSVEIGVKYEGYSDGFTVSLDYYFIMGEPIREAYKVVPIYYGGFPYGDPNNSIENYLKEVTVPVDTFTTEIGLHILQTGHGFGGNEDCAEFCPKYNFIKVNGVQRYSNFVWKDDCGLNPLYPQPGTWLYDRANWCPGEMVRPYYNDLTPYIVPGVPVKIDMNMTPFTNVGNNSCSYNVAANVIYYRNRLGSDDLVLSDVIAPSKDWQHSRFNPICSKPIIEVKNNSANPVNNVHVLYGFTKNPPYQSFTWQGIIEPYSKVKIELDPIDFQNSTTGTFFVKVGYVESKNDYDSTNNSKFISFNKAAILPPNFAIEFRSNSVPTENFYEIFDWQGNQIHYRDNFKANTMHKDTMNLAAGCYTFVFSDTDKDGLSFFANSDGVGSLRLRNSAGTIFQTFNPNFGTEHRYQFIVDPTLVGINQESQDLGIQVYPNPSTGIIKLDVYDEQEVLGLKVWSITGQILLEMDGMSLLSEAGIDLSQLSVGTYFIEIETDKGLYREKIQLIR